MRVRQADESAIREGGAVLARGGLVAFATETVYGLGADALNAVAVAKVFESKRRPSFDPLIVHVGSRGDAWALCDLRGPEGPRASRVIEHLCERFWPGPMTVVLPKAAAVPDVVTSGLGSVGLRVPAHPVALGLIAALGEARREQGGGITAIAAPSANPFGGVSPTRAEHVTVDCDLVLDGGPCGVGVESTVVRPSDDGRGVVVLRLGGLTVEQLEEAVREAGGSGVTLAQAGEKLASPGMLERHYAPGVPVIVGDEASAQAWDRPGRWGLLTLCEPGEVVRSCFSAVRVLSPAGDLREAAASLFAAMRELDDASLDGVLAVAVPEVGLGRAINDRLRRASAR